MPTSSQDRTVSARKRAGSRRNKKQKNIRSFSSDGHWSGKRNMLMLRNYFEDHKGV